MSDESDIEQLREEYEVIRPQADRFCAALEVLLKDLLSQECLNLGAPIECRVKEWEKIKEKIERKDLSLALIIDLDDLVGLRLIFLFSREVDKARDLISQEFDIQESEDTATRLNEDQFGYQSFHYVIKLPEKWLEVPTLRGFDKFRAEIQVRTFAQHIWADASHTLQYKHEDNVPPSVRRSLYRVSALLETVDLEFERALSERDEYRVLIETEIPELVEELLNENLNVDNVEFILHSLLYEENRSGDENYAALIDDLKLAGIEIARDLVELINKHKEKAKEQDRKVAEILIARWKGENLPSIPERIMSESLKNNLLTVIPEVISENLDRYKSGIAYDLTGLVRTSVTFEFGENWREKEN